VPLRSKGSQTFLPSGALGENVLADELSKNMTESLLSLFEDLRRHFRIVDAIDILLMWVIVYSVLLWFQATASRRVLVGFSVLTGVYFAARAFGMQLTSMVFHAWFAVLVIVIVVVFQEDLRRMFERVAEWGILRRRARLIHQLPINADELVEAVFALAGKKTGALIAIKGLDPMRRHLNGGVVLGGKLSAPLLFSIFDSGSAGHDGAVIVRDEQISEFAAHLPVSKNQYEVAGRGTRHAAALGLSECCDALVIVVSEERGMVNVAEGGGLEEIETGSKLMARLERFYTAKFPQPEPGGWPRLVTRHGMLKVFALFLTILAWFALAYDPGMVQRNLVLPIEYRNLPDGLQLGASAPSDARVTLSGPESGFRYLEPNSMVISIDLGGVEEPGVEWVTITEEELSLPAKLSMDEVMPGALRLDLREQAPEPSIVQRAFDVPIEYRNVPTGLQLEASAPSESHVKISGPESQFRLIDPKSMVISIDLDEVTQAGFHWMPITEKALSLPSELTIDEVDPRSLRLELREQEPPPEAEPEPSEE
jgi:diadenylate cyclase